MDQNICEPQTIPMLNHGYKFPERLLYISVSEAIALLRTKFKSFSQMP